MACFVAAGFWAVAFCGDDFGAGSVFGAGFGGGGTSGVVDFISAGFGLGAALAAGLAAAGFAGLNPPLVSEIEDNYMFCICSVVQ